MVVVCGVCVVSELRSQAPNHKSISPANCTSQPPTTYFLSLLTGTGLFLGGLSLNTSLLISTHSVWSSVRKALPADDDINNKGGVGTCVSNINHTEF